MKTDQIFGLLLVIVSLIMAFFLGIYTATVKSTTYSLPSNSQGVCDGYHDWNNCVPLPKIKLSLKEQVE